MRHPGAPQRGGSRHGGAAAGDHCRAFAARGRRPPTTPIPRARPPAVSRRPPLREPRLHVGRRAKSPTSNGCSRRWPRRRYRLLRLPRRPLRLDLAEARERPLPSPPPAAVGPQPPPTPKAVYRALAVLVLAVMAAVVVVLSQAGRTGSFSGSAGAPDATGSAAPGAHRRHRTRRRPELDVRAPSDAARGSPTSSDRPGWLCKPAISTRRSTCSNEAAAVDVEAGVVARDRRGAGRRADRPLGPGCAERRVGARSRAARARPRSRPAVRSADPADRRGGAAAGRPRARTSGSVRTTSPRCAPRSARGSSCSPTAPRARAGWSASPTAPSGWSSASTSLATAPPPHRRRSPVLGPRDQGLPGVTPAVSSPSAVTSAAFPTVVVADCRRWDPANPRWARDASRAACRDHRPPGAPPLAPASAERAVAQITTPTGRRHIVGAAFQMVRNLAVVVAASPSKLFHRRRRPAGLLPGRWGLAGPGPGLRPQPPRANQLVRLADRR